MSIEETILEHSKHSRIFILLNSSKNYDVLEYNYSNFGEFQAEIETLFNVDIEKDDFEIYVDDPITDMQLFRYKHQFAHFKNMHFKKPIVIRASYAYGDIYHYINMDYTSCIFDCSEKLVNTRSRVKTDCIYLGD